MVSEIMRKKSQSLLCSQALADTSPSELFRYLANLGVSHVENAIGEIAKSDVALGGYR